MKNYIKLLSLIMIMSVALIGCKAADNTKTENAIESSTATELDSSTEKEEEKTEEVTKDIISISDEEFVEELRTIVNTSMYPKESLDFFEKYYKSVDSEVASEGLTLILDNISNSQSAIENDFFSGQLDQPLYDAYVYNTETNSGSVDTSKLDTETLSLYEDLIVKNAYRIHSTEGMAYPIIDYSFFEKYFDNLNDELKDIVTLLAMESDEPLYSDAAIAISYDELVNRILSTEDFLINYPGSKFFDQALLNMKVYAQAYFIGSNNTPAFDYEDNKLNDDLKASMESFLKLYPKSKFGEYLNGYYNQVVENELEAVNDYYSNTALELIYTSFDK